MIVGRKKGVYSALHNCLPDRNSSNIWKSTPLLGMLEPTYGLLYTPYGLLIHTLFQLRYHLNIINKGDAGFIT